MIALSGQWTACRKDLYLTAHNTQNRNKITMPLAGFSWALITLSCPHLRREVRQNSSHLCPQQYTEHSCDCLPLDPYTKSHYHLRRCCVASTVEPMSLNSLGNRWHLCLYTFLRKLSYLAMFVVIFHHGWTFALFGGVVRLVLFIYLFNRKFFVS